MNTAKNKIKGAMETVSADLKNISTNQAWRGHLDIAGTGGIVSGWIVCAPKPETRATIEIYVYGVLVGKTTQSIHRPDVAGLIGATAKGQFGFKFDLAQLSEEEIKILLRARKNKTVCDEDPILAVISNEDCCIRVGKQRADREDVQGYLNYRRANFLLSGGIGNQYFDVLDQEAIVSASILFCPRWYKQFYSDVAISKIEPAEHYVRIGAELGRNPSEYFHGANYPASTPQNQLRHLAPLVQYQLGDNKIHSSRKVLLNDQSENEARTKYAALIHIYHIDTIPDIKRAIVSLNGADVYISIPRGSAEHDLEKMKSEFPNAEIFEVDNRGQDIGAFLQVVRLIKGRGYKYFCKLHSKKGNKFPEVWRQEMFNAITANKCRVRSIVETFDKHEDVGMIGPSAFWMDGRDFELSSGKNLRALAGTIGLNDAPSVLEWAFFAGTCFWIRSEYATLLSEKISDSYFSDERVERDGQPAHATERMFGLLIAALGGKAAICSGLDWFAKPVIVSGNEQSHRLAARESARQMLVDHLQKISEPKIIEHGHTLPQEVNLRDQKRTIFPSIDLALHREVDVLVTCWMSSLEPVQETIRDVQLKLRLQGATSIYAASSAYVVSYQQEHSCRGVFQDGIFADIPIHSKSSRDQLLIEESEEDAGLAEELLAVEETFRGRAYDQASKRAEEIERVRFAIAAWRAALKLHKVKIALIWGDTAPKSRMLMHLSRELGIEIQVIERGHFPGTMITDPEGQFGRSAEQKKIPLTDWAESDYTNKRFCEIQNWYEDQEASAYAKSQKKSTPELEEIEVARSNGRLIVLALGANDSGAGLARLGEVNTTANWVKSSENAFSVISRAVEAISSDALIVVRPHPSSKADPDDDRFLVASDTSLNSLIEASDVCVSISTTAHAICLLKEKPVISLGLSEITGSGIVPDVPDESSLLAQLRRAVWSKGINWYQSSSNKKFITMLFDRYLISSDSTCPTHLKTQDLVAHLANRLKFRKSGFLIARDGRGLSEKMFEDVRDRGRAVVRADSTIFSRAERPKVSVVLPIYGDFEGTKLCFEQLLKCREQSQFSVVTVWDRGPDVRLKELCKYYSDVHGFTYLENQRNVGFSGTVNEGIIAAGRDDIILLNSDTIPCGNWVERLQDAAYSHPKIGTVVPLSNSATIYNVPYFRVK